MALGHSWGTQCWPPPWGLQPSPGSPDLAPALFPLGHNSKECGWGPRLGFEGALLSPRVTPGLSETPLYPCLLAKVQ